jgi:hypothetical protein
MPVYSVYVRLGSFARGFSWHVDMLNEWSIYASRTTDSKQIMEAAKQSSAVSRQEDG